MSAAAEQPVELDGLDRLRAYAATKAKPTREVLENSLQSWAAVTVMNAQIVRDEPSPVNVRGLKSSVLTLERILAELEAL